MKVLQEEYIKDSSVTLVLLTENSIIKFNENDKSEKFKWMTREISASLSERRNKNTRNGIILLLSNNVKIWKEGECEKTGKKVDVLREGLLLKNIHIK